MAKVAIIKARQQAESVDTRKQQKLVSEQAAQSKRTAERKEMLTTVVHEPSSLPQAGPLVMGSLPSIPRTASRKRVKTNL
jgi:hypothetical protein